MTLAGDASTRDERPTSGRDDIGTAMPRWFASHELRTPMQAIQGGVELLLEDGGKGLSTLQLEAVSLIADAAGALERCIRRLAELADLTDCQPAPREPLALNAFLALPAIARHVSTALDLAEADDVVVLVASEPASRALAQLMEMQAGTGQACQLSLDLYEVDTAHVCLAIELAAVESGDGAVALRLAARLFEHSGISFDQQADGQARLTLQRASPAPI